MPRRHKYNAIKTIVDGITFSSKKEAKDYSELKLREKAGEIIGLELQPKFSVHVAFEHEGEKIRGIFYIADFKYYDIKKDKFVVRDSKGVKTDVYKIKKKLFLKLYGDIYEFEET